MAEEITKDTDTSKEVGGKKGKGAGKLSKYKWYIVGGVIFVIILVIFFIKSGGGSASANTGDTSTGAATDNGIDPATGYQEGSPADIAALGGSGSVAGTPGPAGPAGPAGPTGPSGPSGPIGGGPVKKPASPTFKTYGGPHATADLYRIATSNGLTEAQLLALNPNLKKYEGSGKALPKKTKVKL